MPRPAAAPGGAAASAAAEREPVRWHPATRELVGGVLAGAVNVTSGYPFDTLKVRLQAGGDAYSGMGDCARCIWRAEGLRGFFRGLSSPLVGGAAETGINYLVYSRVLDLFAPGEQQQQQRRQQQQGQPQQQGREASAADALPPLRAVPVAGAVAGVALSMVLGPTELVKCRMQMAQHASPLRCLAHVVETEGARGLARGLGATVCREVPGNALFFTVYEGLRRSWPGRPPASSGHGDGDGGDEGDGPPGAWRVVLDAGGAIVCGGLAGTVMWATVLPLDVAKTRIQTAAPGSAWDTGVLAQLRMMWREGGRRTLWAGLQPTLLRAFPANAAQWLAWELAMRRLLPPAAEERGQGQAALQQQQLQGAAAL